MTDKRISYTSKYQPLIKYSYFFGVWDDATDIPFIFRVKVSPGDEIMSQKRTRPGLFPQGKALANVKVSSRATSLL